MQRFLHLDADFGPRGDECDGFLDPDPVRGIGAANTLAIAP